MKNLRVAAITNCVPHYRKRFWERVHERGELDVTLFCQTEQDVSGLQLVHDEIPQKIVPSRLWGVRRSFGWQQLPLSLLSSDFDVFYWMGNPRLISSLLWTALLAGLGNPVVLVGQAHSKSSSAGGETLRLAWWRQFKHLLVYTDAGEQYLRTRGFDNHYIRGLNNGLDQRRIDAEAGKWSSDALLGFAETEGIDERTVTVSLGRVSDRQELIVLIEALPQLVKRHPDLLHVVIGDGPERLALEARAEQLGVAEHVRWLGAIWDEKDLAPWLLSATAMVHPGMNGLGLMHSFGYGLPLVTQDNPRQHGPEFSAFEDGVTGLGFSQGDASSLIESLSALLRDRDAARRMGKAALQRVRTQYNVDVMVDRFTEVICAAHKASS